MLNASMSPNQGDHHWIGVLKALADHHPGLLESADLPHSLRNTARTVLVRSRLEKDFNGEFNRLIASPDGQADFQKALDDHETASKFSKDLLGQIHRFPADWLNSLVRQSHALTRNDAEAWLALDLQALGMSEANANSFHGTAWQLLAQTNPATVLERLSDMDGHNDGEINSHLAIALRSLDRKSPEEAAQWLAHYESRTDNESHIQQLRHALVSEARAGQKPSAESLLASLQHSTAGADLFNLSFQFLNAPLEVQKEFTNSIMAMEPEKQSQIGYSNESHTYGRFPITLQASLITSMIEYPPDDATPDQRQGIVRTTSGLASQWVIEDPAAASRWAARLPAGEPRQWALRNAAANWMPYDPMRSQAWLNQLPAADRADVQEFLDSNPKPR